ncbi:MAG: carboxypeptidase-like regulatory domain-containing protein [Alistipes sp.]
MADTKGNFRMMNMQPGGPYTVTYTMIGYQGVERTGIEIPWATPMWRTPRCMSRASVWMPWSYQSKARKRDEQRAGRRGNQRIPPGDRNDADRVAQHERHPAPVAPIEHHLNGFAVGGSNYRQSYVTVDGAAFNNAFGIGGNPRGGQSHLARRWSR